MGIYHYNKKKIYESMRSPEVAGAANIKPSIWARKHIFDDGIGEAYIRGRSRGRCPFIEVSERTETDYTQIAEDANEVTSNIILRINVSGYNVQKLRDECEKIIKAFLFKLYENKDMGTTRAVVGSFVSTVAAGYQELSLTFIDYDSDQNFDYGEV